MRSINVSNGYWVANATWMALNPPELPSTHPLLHEIRELSSVAHGDFLAIKLADQYLQRLFLWHTLNLKKQDELQAKIVTTEFRKQTILNESFPNFKNKDEKAKSWREAQVNLEELEVRVEKAGKRLENYEMNIPEEVLDLISRKYGTSDYDGNTLKKWRDNSTAKKYDFELISEQRKKLYADFERLQRKVDSEKTLISKMETKLLALWEKNQDQYLEHEAILYIEKELIELIKERDLQESIVKSNTLECMEARRKMYTAIHDYHKNNNLYILKIANSIYEYSQKNANFETKLLPQDAFLKEKNQDDITRRKNHLQKIGWAFINHSEMLEIVETLSYPYWIAMAYGNAEDLTHVQMIQQKMNPPEFKLDSMDTNKNYTQNTIGIAQ